MGDDLGVGLAGQRVAGRLEPGAQRGEVLDDAVVDHGDRAVAGQVRVGVAVVGPAVGRPAGVPDAGGAGRQRVLGDQLLEVGQLAGLARRLEPAPAVEDGHARTASAAACRRGPAAE